MNSEARLITDELMQDPALQELFSQHLTSSWRDLARFIRVCREHADDLQHAAVTTEALNLLDIAAAGSPVYDSQFREKFSLIERTVEGIANRLGINGLSAIIQDSYQQVVEERYHLRRKYHSLRPEIGDLLLGFSTDAGHDVTELAKAILTRCCHAVMGLLDANRALLALRKEMAYDTSNSTFSSEGMLWRVVASRSREHEATFSDPADQGHFNNELEFLRRDESANVARGLYTTPEYATVVDGECPILWYANAEHFATLYEHAGKHFESLNLLVGYVVAYLEYRRSVLKLPIPDTEELRAIDFDNYYGPQQWLYFDGGYFDYDPRLVIPLKAGGQVFGLLSIDDFAKDLGDLILDLPAKQTMRAFELYRRERKTALVKHIGPWLREHYPDLVPEILAAAPDANRDEEKFLAYRAVDMIDSDIKREFFAHLDTAHGIRFKPSDTEVDHLLSFFNSRRPVSRQAISFAELMAKDISSQLAMLNALRAAETMAHHNALTHVSKERSLTSRTLRHEGINKLTALRNTISDAESYLGQIRSAWHVYVQEFGEFSAQHIDSSLFEQLGKIIEPLDRTFSGVDEGIERVLKASRIGDELNALFLRHKGGEFRKEYVLIHEVLEEVLERYNALYFEGPNIQVIRNYGVPEVLVFCYRELMITVFCTYLDNAIEALRKVNRNRQITITTTADEETFHFEICDTGAGFWQNQKLTDNPMTLYTSYSSKGGREHGVGLRIVSEIINDMTFHNGTLDVPRSEPGSTTFGFSIPTTEARVVRLRGRRTRRE